MIAYKAPISPYPNPEIPSLSSKNVAYMLEFYLAVRAYGAQSEYVISNYDRLAIIQKELSLPRLGFLMLPRRDLIEIAKNYEGIPFALDNGAFQFLKCSLDDTNCPPSSGFNKWIETLCGAFSEANWEWVALPDIPVHGRKFVLAPERLRRIIAEETKPGDIVVVAGIGNTAGIAQ